MQSVGYAALEVIPSMRGFEGKLSSQTNPIMSRSGVKGGAAFGDSAGRSMSSRFVSHAKTAAILAGGALLGVAAVGIKIGRNSIEEAREAQRVGAITTRVIKSTGQAANVTAGQVGKLSTAISNRVGIDDEAIQSGANLLLTFKNIQNQAGKGNKVFNDATKITTDMAVAMAGGNGGTVDLKSSSILVGKALNDPVKGLTALTRVGVSFTDQQKQNIESLVKQGDTMAAQKIILGELQSEFGGTAKAQATMGDKVKVAWGNIEESIGKTLLPLIDDLEKAFLKKGVPALEDFSDWFAHDGKKGIHDFIEDAKPLANSILPAAKNGLKDIAHFLGDAAPKAKSVIDAFNRLPDWAQKAVVLGTAGGLIAKKTGLLSVGSKVLTGGGASGGLLGLISKNRPIPVFVVNGAGVIPGGGKGPGGVPIVDPHGGVGVASRAAVEREAQAAARAAFEGPGSLASRSSAAARAFKEVMAAHDAAVLKEALNFGIKGGSRTFAGGLLRTLLAAPAGVSLGDVGNETGRKLDERAFPEVDFSHIGTEADFKRMLAARNSIKATGDQVDALKQNLGKASQALDLVSNRGTQAFGGLSGNIDASTNRANILDRRLRNLPPNIRTELQFDDREARRRLAAFREAAQKSLSLELTGPHIGRPGGDPLSGVRRP